MHSEKTLYSVMKPYLTIGLLVISNIFMTFAWYGQLRLKGQRWFDNLPLLAIIQLCWGVALFEYMFQVLRFSSSR